METAIFSKFEIASINDGEIVAKSHGRLIGDNRNRLKREIKAATFHDLAIKEDSQGLSVEIVFDI